MKGKTVKGRPLTVAGRWSSQKDRGQPSHRKSMPPTAAACRNDKRVKLLVQVHVEVTLLMKFLPESLVEVLVESCLSSWFWLFRGYLSGYAPGYGP
jgi:hypothetical protein